ncbi:copper-binding protein [Hyalangium versicolor]|uniref:copper-binding protein n=1 Tax=Hyalangium versicolor TaxID=2861190 RepID=UPI001CCDA925|nr:copper-binding protein [Hyalangium versicolor]
MNRGYLGLWSAVLAAAPALAQAPAAEVRSLREVQGTIKAVDVDAGTLTLEHERGQVALRVDGNTTIFLPGHTGKLDELKVGQRVRGVYEPRERGAVAQWLELMGP